MAAVTDDFGHRPVVSFVDGRALLEAHVGARLPLPTAAELLALTNP